MKNLHPWGWVGGLSAKKGTVSLLLKNIYFYFFHGNH